MAVLGVDLGIGGLDIERVEKFHDLTSLGRRIEPIRGEGDHQSFFRAHILDIAPAATFSPGTAGRTDGSDQVEIVDGIGDIEIAVGVEAFDKGDALVVEVMFDLEGGPEYVWVCRSFRKRPNFSCMRFSER